MVLIKNYQRLQKELFSYKREKYNIVNEVDYSDLYSLRREISSKIHSLKQEIRKILDKNLKKN